jgi:CRP-like cAMP-binding protein
MFDLLHRKSTTTRTIESSLRPTFTTNEIASMAGLGTLITLADRRELMTEGTAGNHVYFLVQGTAAVSRCGEVIAMLSPGDMVGERAFVTCEPRNATITALGPIIALQFDQQQFAWLRLESAKVKGLSDTLVSSRC